MLLFLSYYRKPGLDMAKPSGTNWGRVPILKEEQMAGIFEEIDA